MNSILFKTVINKLFKQGMAGTVEASSNYSAEIRGIKIY